jgi:hypothetical protein
LVAQRPNDRIAPVERVVWTAVVLGQLVLAPFFVDLFPFSTMPMFSAAPRQLLGLEILDEQSRRLPLNRFGIRTVYLANPRPRVGLRDPGAVLLDDFELSAVASLVTPQLGRGGIPTRVRVRRNRLALDARGALHVVAFDEVWVPPDRGP